MLRGFLFGTALGVTAAVAVPVSFGARSARAAQPDSFSGLQSFEAASLKPNKSGPGPFGIVPLAGGRLRGTNIPAKFLIAAAFAENGAPLHESRIVGGPKWLDSTRFDLEAKAAEPVRTDVLFTMLRSLLVARWQLVVHRETRDVPVYALVMARRNGELGAQLRRSTVDCDTLMAQIKEGVLPTQTPNARPLYRAGVDRITGTCARISMLATSLSQSPLVGRRVDDRTDLSGWFDIELTWTPEQPPAEPTPDARAPIPADIPGLFTALQEQLGLKLESTRAPAEVLIIDSAELPPEI